MAKEASRAPAARSESELREALMRADALRQELSALEGQRELLVDLLSDVTRSLSTITAMASAKEGDEVLVPVGAGTYVHAKLARPGAAITTLGSSVHAELSLEAVEARLRERAEGIDVAAKRTTADMNRVIDEMNRINAMLEEAQGA